ncbi:hypothetical protein [Limimaricola pyoseonensis]|uniref:Uncharacterized protein n=1 Tax=Limimaricola pyoseonensis TaxID=521013 RepID=A0A1G7AEB9_9RHOB|nr:hypothetical protein [Limimaricola pyoseonensis]SDE13161.1 hypothetical protein SAMN04488567_0921 [Limimaricola pyoseonensis]
MPVHWLLRLTHWARHPPSPRRIGLILAVIAACLLLGGIEWLWGWPEALGVERVGRGVIPR